jgi:3',5'-cyclic AMP phosphodiesterase CpdA
VLVAADGDATFNAVAREAFQRWALARPSGAAALQRAAARAAADHAAASGDITQRARPAEFDAALRFFNRLAARHALGQLLRAPLVTSTRVL